MSFRVGGLRLRGLDCDKTVFTVFLPSGGWGLCPLLVRVPSEDPSVQMESGRLHPSLFRKGLQTTE